MDLSCLEFRYNWNLTSLIFVLNLKVYFSHSINIWGLYYRLFNGRHKVQIFFRNLISSFPFPTIDYWMNFLLNFEYSKTFYQHFFSMFVNLVKSYYNCWTEFALIISFGYRSDLSYWQRKLSYLKHQNIVWLLEWAFNDQIKNHE